MNYTQSLIIYCSVNKLNEKNQSPENEIFAEFESEAEMINNDDLNRIVSGEKSINNKSSKLDTGKFKKTHKPD